jgi:hypothetical protein
LWNIITPTDWRILVPSQPHDYGWRELKKSGEPIELSGVVWNKRTGEVSQEGITVKANYQDFTNIMVEKMKSYGGGLLLRSVTWITLTISKYIYKIYD